VEGYTTREAVWEDLGAVLGVQVRAFGRVARELSICPSELPPLNETNCDLERLMDQGTRFFVAVAEDGGVIGSVRGTERDGTVEIGRLVVEAGWLRRGVATCLMDLLESSFSASERFELFTGAEAKGALTLYGGRGYRECRREGVGGVELVWLEKMAPRALL
jgi:hypothetical protein